MHAKVNWIVSLWKKAYMHRCIIRSSKEDTSKASISKGGKNDERDVYNHRRDGSLFWTVGAREGDEGEARKGTANSPWTVQGESMSAGRIYDKIGDGAVAKVMYVTPKGVLCRITDTGCDM